MIVDDEEEILANLGRVLRRANYEVILASKGALALELADKHLPDLILLDIVMPDMDGGDVAAKLSRNKATANIPIIFLTGVLTKNEENAITSSGGRYVMAKPVTPREVLEMIDKVFAA